MKCIPSGSLNASSLSEIGGSFGPARFLLLKGEEADCLTVLLTLRLAIESNSLITEELN